MTHPEKKQELTKVRYAIRMAQGFADEMELSTNITLEQASELRRRCGLASATALEFENLMRGVERPKNG